MKCEICNTKIQEGILKKIIGTYIKTNTGKKKPICNTCQKQFSTKEIKEKIN
ncbi:MAG: hypothetical protein ACLFN8_02365 [Candidatus Woesearchaeota archaeon]